MGVSILPNIREKGVYNAQAGKEFLEVYQFNLFLPVLFNYLTQSQNVSEDQKVYLEKIRRDLTDYLSMSAYHSATYSSVLKIASDMVMSGKVPQVCKSCPVREAEDRLLLDLACEVCKISPDLL